jgi:hypothetical protein
VRDGAGERIEGAGALLDRIHALGGAVGAATREGRVRHEARAAYHGFLREEPIRRGGRILGYRERPEAGRPGFLEVAPDGLAFRPDDGSQIAWPLLDLVAMQVASRSLQVGVRGVGTAQFTLLDDSLLRWEELLQELLRRAWREAEKGEIVEFQPRIVAS